MFSAARILTAAAICLVTGAAQAAGVRALNTPALTGAVWSPCLEPAGAVALGPVDLPGVLNCPLPEGRRPLIVISHGRGGLFASHHDTAAALADAGFIVAAIDHPGDNARDLRRTDSVSVMVERPAAIMRLIDHLTGASPLAAHIDPERIGFFGFSRGGYTGLVLIGATPDWAKPGCDRLSPWCAQRYAGAEAPLLVHDPRIKAAVIVDPLAMFFTAEELAAIKTPVFLWASEDGGEGVAPGDVARVARSLPAARDYRVAANAGHFAFLVPCSAARALAQPRLCVDPPGFDREAFHREFNAATAAFLKNALHVVE